MPVRRVFFLEKVLSKNFLVKKNSILSKCIFKSLINVLSKTLLFPVGNHQKVIISRHISQVKSDLEERM